MTPEERAFLARPVESLEDIARLFYGPSTPIRIDHLAGPAAPVAAAAPRRRGLTDDQLYDELFGS